MERKLKSKSKSPKKHARKDSLRKNHCQLCKSSICYSMVTAHSLYKKYSYSQNHHYLKQIQTIKDKLSESVSTAEEEPEQFMSRYYKPSSRKQAMLRAKELYVVQRDLPRIYHLFISDILAKSHHRKRLIEYFKLASSLGLKVNSLAFSSFALSVRMPKASSPSTFERVLIGNPQVSGEVQREILEALSSS